MTDKKKTGDTHNKFSPTEKEWLMREIADRDFRNMYQSLIAEEINALLKERGSEKTISRRLVGYYLEKLQERYQKEAMIKVEAVKARELAKINNLEREAWKAWLRTLKPVSVKKAKKSQKEGTIENQEFDSLGDPRYLAEIRACMKARRELQGLDAPKRFIQDGIVITIEWEKLTTDEVDRIRRGENPIHVLTPDKYRTTDAKK